MKVRHIEDTDALFALIDSCAGPVELVTESGDHLNLKSKLSQCVAVANIFSNPRIQEWEIQASDPGDDAALAAFFQEQPDSR